MADKTERAAVRITPVVQEKVSVLVEEYGTLTTVFTVAVERLYDDMRKETIKLTIEWLNNLEADIGLERLLDNCPNGWGGREDLEKLL